LRAISVIGREQGVREGVRT